MRWLAFPCVTMIPLLAQSVTAAQLLSPAPALDRDQTAIFTFRSQPLATGTGQMQIVWTDSTGRRIEDRSVSVKLNDETDIRFPLDMRRAIAMQNHLEVHFTFDGLNKKGEPDHRKEEASIDFVARPTDSKWWDYMAIMWQDGAPEHWRRLTDVGVNAGKSAEHSMAIPEALLANNIRWYVENMATDFFSTYHIYRADRPYNDAFLQAKAAYKANPENRDSLKRNPSFEDPAWNAAVRDRLLNYARVYSPYRPLFYNLADESGIAELAGFWDFDFSDYSLSAMRRWLQTRYATIDDLNAQWGSYFSSWDLVVPETTRQAIRRKDENYSSWADFKEWMDISFAAALKRGADAIHEVDPSALVGIEGAQMPGWGGYDYYRLANSLQAMEPYDIGDNVEIIRSLNPNMAFVTTAFEKGAWEKHRLWYELLHGARGHIIWDEKNDIVTPAGDLGERGQDVRDQWRELRAGIGALFINSVRQSDPIAIHYSQASMRTDWMLQQRENGDAWVDRMSWDERKSSRFLVLRNSYCRLIEDAGLQYNFVAYAQLEAGELLRRGYRVLILPESNSLSEKEASAIITFVHQGGTLVIDGDAGTFDEHSRRLPESRLAVLLDGDTGTGKVVRLKDALSYAQARVLGTGNETHAAMLKLLTSAGVQPRFAVVGPNHKPVVGLETHEFRNGGVTIIGILSNPQMQIDDLGQPDVSEELKSRRRFEDGKSIRLIPPVPMYAYDLRKRKSLGLTTGLALTVDPYEPTVIAFGPQPFPTLVVSAPKLVRRGQNVEAGMFFQSATLASTHIFHVEIRDPAGHPLERYSGNLLATNGKAEKLIPIALNDSPGRWVMKVTDVMSAQEVVISFEVE